MERSKLRVLLLRHNKVDPDPRVEKEVNSLLTNDNVQIEVLAWDRSENYAYRKDALKLDNGTAVIHRIGVVAGWGVGIRKNTTAFIKYTFKTCYWMMRNHKAYDIVHACDLQTMVPALLPLVLYRKTLVYDICDYFSDSARGSGIVLRLAKGFETAVINRAAAAIICSEQRQQQIQPAKPKKLVVLHNAPAKHQLLTNSGKVCRSDSDKPKVVYVGNLVADRCIPEIVEMAKKLPDVEFHIGGLGALQNVVEEPARELENLFFYGKLKYADVLSLENSCDIMLAFYDQKIRNHQFAAPNKFYEAIGLGKPLMMLHHTGMDDLIDRYDLGITVDQNLQSMIGGLQTLLARKDEWPAMSERGKRLFSDSFCWEIMGQRLNALYDEIAACGKK